LSEVFENKEMLQGEFSKDFHSQQLTGITIKNKNLNERK